MHLRFADVSRTCFFVYVSCFMGWYLVAMLPIIHTIQSKNFLKVLSYVHACRNIFVSFLLLCCDLSSFQKRYTREEKEEADVESSVCTWHRNEGTQNTGTKFTIQIFLRLTLSMHKIHYLLYNTFTVTLTKVEMFHNGLLIQVMQYKKASSYVMHVYNQLKCTHMPHMEKGIPFVCGHAF